MSLPGLDQLESTPETLRLLMGGLTEEDTNWKPSPNSAADMTCSP